MGATSSAPTLHAIPDADASLLVQRNISLINICVLAETLGVKPAFLMEFSLAGSEATR